MKIVVRSKFFIVLNKSIVIEKIKNKNGRIWKNLKKKKIEEKRSKAV